MQEQTIQTMSTQLGTQIGQEIEHVIVLGMPLQQIQTATREYLSTIQKKLPWISGIGIIENDYSVLISSEQDIAQNITQNITKTDWDAQKGTSILVTVAIHKTTPVETAKQRLNLRELLSFFSDPRRASLLFLNIFPCAFIYVCLFKFYIPISLNEAGSSPAAIGRVSMLFCLMVVYLGPVFGHLIDQGKNKVLWLGGAGFICAGSVIVLPMADGISVAMLSVALLGIASAIVSSAQGAYALDLPATANLGVTHAMGIYNVTERAGQMLGPIMLGLFIVSFGAGTSLVAMAVILALMSTLFIFFAKIFAPKKEL